MNNDTNEPVEISTRMREGEWSQATLTELVGSYEDKLREMGASPDEIETRIKERDDGSVDVNVCWRRAGVHTSADTGRGRTREAENARGSGEVIPVGEATKDSQGLGAVLGDAERSAIDAPPTPRAMQAQEDQQVQDYVVFTSDEGKRYVEDAGPAEE